MERLRRPTTAVSVPVPVLVSSMVSVMAERVGLMGLKSSLQHTQRLVGQLSARINKLHHEGNTLAAQEAENQRDARLQQLQSLEEKVPHETVKRHVIKHIHIGTKLGISRCISSPCIEDEIGYGFIVPFNDDGCSDDSGDVSGQSAHKDKLMHVAQTSYLKQGRYKVQYLYNTAVGEVTSAAELMDFPTITQCIAREGQELFMLIDSESLADLNDLSLGLYTRNITENQMVSNILRGGSCAYLKVFYVLFKKAAEYAPYGPLYMYFVATCVVKYAKFGWSLTPGPADLIRGSQTVREMAARILSSQYNPMFQPTHKMSAASFFQKDEYDRMVDSDEEVRSAMSALFHACP